jgi:predicted site-specific integrase-resolvase
LQQERVDASQRDMKAIERAQEIRDRHSRTNLEATHIVIGLRQYTILGVDYQENKEDLVRTIDEYLSAVRARLKANRFSLRIRRENCDTGSSSAVHPTKTGQNRRL